MGCNSGGWLSGGVNGRLGCTITGECGCGALLFTCVYTCVHTVNTSKTNPYLSHTHPPHISVHNCAQLCAICTLIYRRIGLLKRDQAQYITGDEKNERARMCTNVRIFATFTTVSTPPPLLTPYCRC